MNRDEFNNKNRKEAVALLRDKKPTSTQARFTRLTKRQEEKLAEMVGDDDFGLARNYSQALGNGIDQLYHVYQMQELDRRQYKQELATQRTTNQLKELEK